MRQKSGQEGGLQLKLVDETDKYVYEVTMLCQGEVLCKNTGDAVMLSKLILNEFKFNFNLNFNLIPMIYKVLDFEF